VGKAVAGAVASERVAGATIFNNNMNTEPIHIISLGAGVQSSTMALMAAHGEIGPMPTAAVFADTGHETEDTYAYLEGLRSKLPFPIHVVKAMKDTLGEYALKPHIRKRDGAVYHKWGIPAFADVNGKKGIIGRKCTTDFKVIPLVRFTKALAKSLGKPPVIQWIGISLDEAHRMKPSRDKGITMRWPLIDARMSRWDCLRWLDRNGYEEAPRSACVFCPLHADGYWKRLKEKQPNEFEKAVAFEAEMHEAFKKEEVLRHKPYLHDSLIPLKDVDFKDDIDRGQIELQFGNACEGLCGV